MGEQEPQPGLCSIQGFAAALEKSLQQPQGLRRQRTCCPRPLPGHSTALGKHTISLRGSVPLHRPALPAHLCPGWGILKPSVKAQFQLVATWVMRKLWGPDWPKLRGRGAGRRPFPQLNERFPTEAASPRSWRCH